MYTDNKIGLHYAEDQIRDIFYLQHNALQRQTSSDTTSSTEQCSSCLKQHN